ncbi:hypothetical protein [Agrobacterium tumefaciens]|uniref:hypothetical protein n=1 Tax=Agrobacterium tumefaciens TaxID=358 RepID=UPI0013AFA164|nr:hypothetical protein [Agrobacterium tumefaciens]UXS97889.1 hypothetical protein FY143_14550 [Agrobacterium tumefaciens]
MVENKAEHMAIGIGAEIELLARHFNQHGAMRSATGPQKRKLDGTARAENKMIPSDQSGYEGKQNRMSGALGAGHEWK